MELARLYFKVKTNIEPEEYVTTTYRSGFIIKGKSYSQIRKAFPHYPLIEIEGGFRMLNQQDIDNTFK